MNKIMSAFEPFPSEQLPVATDRPEDGEALPQAISIYADRLRVMAELADDATAAGFRIAVAGSTADLIGGEARALGDVILLDVPAPDAAQLAALAGLDVRAAQAGAQMVVSTTLGGLDAVFACLDQSSPQILVDPTRAERVVALGRVLASPGRGRVCELSGADRMALLRLTEQVAQIAERLEAVGGPLDPGAMDDRSDGSRVGSPMLAFNGERSTAQRQVRASRPSRPALPDPQLVRQIIRNRQRRSQYFEADLFADPAWDILLDLTAAKAERTRVSVTSLCIASGVPPTTALRWIGQMTEHGLLERVEDECDRRRAFIVLSGNATTAMAGYFAGLGREAVRLG